jgi:predicted unusual protein kinase regulating ubiquinone biosynthesis (AarF/ABC1/UbiB family)
LKWLRLYESLQQSVVFMMSQVDLSREAAHLNRFIYNFRRSKDVSFPIPLYPLVHPSVLVETRVEVFYILLKILKDMSISKVLSLILEHMLF